ncbi:hypothetical protein PQO01_17950 [Lentisphaera marina]|uniref:hypothetical protein n=1 Tax=Lentisphaera marina TaxID=1111041 RepID=UPI002366B4E7|nr:hypothetical protein [Lentisphaera marina]MDD7986838.1 hypothetical protein [Lentisphaera marina]
MNRIVFLFIMSLLCLSTNAFWPWSKEDKITNELSIEKLEFRIDQQQFYVDAEYEFSGMAGHRFALGEGMPIQSFSYSKNYEISREGNRYFLVLKTNTKNQTCLVTYQKSAEKQGEKYSVKGLSLPMQTLRPFALSYPSELKNLQFNQSKIKLGGIEEGRASFSGKLPLQKGFSFTWEQEQDEKTKPKALDIVKIKSQVLVVSGALQLDVIYDWSVINGARKKLMFDLPQNFVLTNVLAKGFEIKESQEEGQRLLTLESKTSHTRMSIRLKGEISVDQVPAEHEIILPVPQKVLKSSGELFLKSMIPVKVITTNHQGLIRVEGKVQKGSQLYSFPSLPIQLDLKLKEIKPVVDVSANHDLFVKENDIRHLSSFKLDVREAALDELSFRLEGDFIPVAVNGVNSYEVEDFTGYRILRVRLAEIQGIHNITIEQERAISDWSKSFVYPSVSCIGVRSERGFINVGALEGFSVNLNEVKGLLELPENAVAKRLKNQQSTWRFRELGWGSTVSVKKLKPRIKVEGLHMYSLGESTVYASSLFTMKISAAPTSKLKLAIPAKIKNPEISGNYRPQLKKVSEGIYEITLNQRIMGSYNLLVSYDAPSEFKESDLSCGEVRLLNAESESGYITLSGSNTIRSQSYQSEDGVFQIEEKQLPEAYQMLHSNPLIQVFRYTTSPHQVQVKLKTLADVNLLGHVIASSMIQSTLVEDGSASHKASFMVGNRNRQFLSITMKEGSVLGRCKVEGELVRPIADDKKLLIPLKRNTDPNKLLKVELTWTSKQNALKDGEDLQLNAPSLDAVTLHSEWELNLPKAYLLSDIESNILPQEHYERGGDMSFLDKCRLVIRKLNWPSLILLTLSCLALPFASVFKIKASFVRILLTLMIAVFSIMYLSSLRIEVQNGIELPQEVYTFRSMSLKELAQPYIKAKVNTLSSVNSSGPHLSHVIMLGLAFLMFVMAFVKKSRLLSGGAFLVLCYSVQSWAYAELLYLSLMPLLLVLSAALFMGPYLLQLCKKLRPASALILCSFCLMPSVEASEKIDQKQKELCVIVEENMFSDAQIDVELDESYKKLKVKIQAHLNGDKGDVFYLIPQRLQVLASLPKGQMTTMESIVFDKKIAETHMHPSGALSLKLLEKVERFEVNYSYSIEAVQYVKESQVKLKNEEAYFSEKLNFDWSFLPNSSVKRLNLKLIGESWQAKSKLMLSREDSDGFSQFTLLENYPREFVRETLDDELTQADFYAEQEVRLVASEGLLSLEQNFHLRLMNGILPSVVLKMPENWQLESVLSANPKKSISWDYDATTRDLKLTFLNSENEKNLSFKISSRRTNLRLPQTVKLELAHLEGARSVRGRMIMASQLGLAMRVMAPVNCRKLSGRPKVDFTTEPESDLSAWQFSSAKPTLNLQLSKVRSELSLFADHHFHLSSNRLSLNSNLQIKVKKSGVFNLKIKVPVDYEVENVQCQNLSYWDVEHDDESKVLSLYLSRKILGQLPVQLSLVKIVPEIPTKPSVPHLTLVDGGRQTGSLLISVEKGFHLEVLQSQNTSTASRKEDGSQSLRLLASGWSVDLLKKTLEASQECQFMQTMRLEDKLLKGMMKMDIQIEKAPIRTLRFTSDQALDNLDIRGKNIARLRTVDKNNWELDLQSPQIGKLSFELNWQSAVTQQEIDLAPIKLLAATRQTGHLIFFAASNISLKYESLKGFKKIDFRELDSLKTPKDLANSRACFKSLNAASQMKVHLDVKSLAKSLPAEVKSLDIKTQVGIDSSQISHLSLLMDPVTKPYLKVILPAGARLMNVNIDQKTVRPMDREGHILIPLKSRPTQVGQKNVEIEILYINEASELSSVVGPAFDLPLKDIRWNIYMPENAIYKDFSGNMKYLETYTLANLVSSEEVVNHYGLRGRTESMQKKSIDQGLLMSKQGRNVEARVQLEQVVEESLGDKGKQEDAKMQLNKLWRTQAQMAIANRRDNLLMMGKDLKFNKNYNVNDVRALEQNLQENDSLALGSIGEKIFSRQKAARKRVQALALDLPEHGKQLEFHREMMIDLEKPLQIDFKLDMKSNKVNKSSQLPSIFLFLLSFCVGMGLIYKLK